MPNFDGQIPLRPFGAVAGFRQGSITGEGSWGISPAQSLSKIIAVVVVSLSFVIQSRFCFGLSWRAASLRAIKRGRKCVVHTKYDYEYKINAPPCKGALSKIANNLSRYCASAQLPF
jgi:hypothetical protein